jgi:hypothetical protein
VFDGCFPKGIQFFQIVAVCSRNISTFGFCDVTCVLLSVCAIVTLSVDWRGAVALGGVALTRLWANCDGRIAILNQEVSAQMATLRKACSIVVF